MKQTTRQKIEANKATYRRTQKQRTFAIDPSKLKYAKAVDNFLEKVGRAYESSKNSTLVFRGRAR